MKPLNMHGHANPWQEELIEVVRERDKLRAEIERLRKASRGDPLDTAQLRIEKQAQEIERLRAVLRKWRPAIERGRDWYDKTGNEREARGFAAMLADFDAV